VTATTAPMPAAPTTGLAVDWTRCDGHGVCAALLPDQIARDAWGYPVLRGTAVPLADARRAVHACPALALHLTRRSS
jgi:ferredoxin